MTDGKTQTTRAGKVASPGGTVMIHRGKYNPTTAMVCDPDQVRHPTTQRFQKKWQNEQSSDFNIKSELNVDAGE